MIQWVSMEKYTFMPDDCWEATGNPGLTVWSWHEKGTENGKENGYVRIQV